MGADRQQREPNRMRVLIAEDEPVSRAKLSAMCERWGFEVVTAVDGAEAIQVLTGPDAPRLALLDWVMPGVSGLEVCQEVRARGAEHYVYLVLLSSKSSESDVIKAFQAGADDYMIKPASIAELHVRLHAGRRVLELHDNLLQANDHLRTLIERDPKTGLHGEAATLRIVGREVARAESAGTPLAAILLELDGLEELADLHGRASRDLALEETARRLRVALRPFDSLGYLGAGRYLALLPGRDGLAARTVAEQLREAAALPPIQAPTGALRLTASAGVTSWSYEPSAAFPAERLLESCEAGLARARAAGRNRVSLEQPELDSPPTT